MFQAAVITDIRTDGKVWWSDQAGCEMHPWLVTFDDGMVGCANSKTNPPPYQIGDQVWYEVTGQTKRGDNKLSIKNEDPSNRGGGGRQQQQRNAHAHNRQPAPARGAPAQRQAPSSQGQPPAKDTRAIGQRTGMAMNIAVDLAKLTNAENPQAIGTPDFWREVYQYASDVYRIADVIERGILAPNQKSGTPNAPAPEEQPPEDEPPTDTTEASRPAPRPQAQGNRPAARPAARPAQQEAQRPRGGPDGQAFNPNDTPIDEQDVPF